MSVSQESLHAIDVSKTYRPRSGEETRALETTNLEVAPSEFVSLVGPSGCGKTTLLKICAGLLPPTTGRVGVAAPGETEMREPSPQEIGFVFQSSVLLPWRNIIQNVMLPSAVFGYDTKRYEERAREFLGLMKLVGTEEKYPSELSGGMQQRASIARALVHDPQILFMDEPFGALDAMTRERQNMLLQEVHQTQQKTILFVTHSISEAVLLSDRIIVMSAGPGRVVNDIRVDLERPRTLDMSLEEDFREVERTVRECLNEHAGTAAAT